MLEQRYAAQIPQALLEQLHEADGSRASQIGDRFAETTAAAGLSDTSEFVQLDPSRDGTLEEFARGFDLVVTSPHSEAANESHLSANPDLIALKSGRPVLVVPNGYETDGLAERALIAWDGKRSSARAIGDAMDILAEKSKVTLLSVGTTPKGTDQMVANMRRHSVDVQASCVERSGSVSDTILAEARAMDARLIVMGAYEHSKFSHDIFGGVTTEVIRDTSVPVFMAH